MNIIHLLSDVRLIFILFKHDLGRYDEECIKSFYE